jgi:aminoglycoside 6'-N-acetyltransferase
MAETVMSFDEFDLVAMTVDDLPLVIEWRSRPAVHEWYGGRPVTVEEIRKRHLESPDPVSRCIVHLDGAPIGFLQFYEYIDAWKQAIDLRSNEEAWGIDLYIGEPDLHGQGIGTRLVSGVAQRLADGPGPDRVVIDPHVGNTAAVRCYQKAGFAKVRLMPSYERVRGEWRDAWLMEWQPHSHDRLAD